MTDDWWFLQDGEEIIWQGSPRLSAAAGEIAIAVGVVVLSIIGVIMADPIFAAGSLLGVSLAGWAVLRVKRTEYHVTSRAVWLKRGIFGRSVRRVGLPKIQNTAFSQSATGSLFGYGTVTIEVAGGPDLRFRRIGDPQTVQTAITDRIGNHQRELPGTTAQWQDVLSLVRSIRTAIE